MISILSVALGYAREFRNLSHLERDSVTQLVMVCSLPILYYTLPRAASVYLPILCAATAVSIVHQKIREAELSQKIVSQNKELEAICKSFQEIADGLEKGINGCLKVTERKDAVIQAVDKIEEEISQKVERVKSRILTLSVICQKAQSKSSVMQLLATVKENEARLTEITLETTRLNQEIDAVIERLKVSATKLEQHAILRELIEKLGRDHGNKSNC